MARGRGSRKHGGDRRRQGGGSGYDRKDSYYRRAKEEGYRSRAAYKLLELVERFKLIPRGGRVLDLGCWPGGWLQVAVGLAGPHGTVVGVDLQETEPVSGALVIQGDVTEASVIDQLRAAAPGGAYDVVLSDLSPKLTGVRFTDEARAGELNQVTLGVAETLLKPGGILVMKTFMSAETEAMMRSARGLFSAVKLTNLEASRKGSSEHYLIARDRRLPEQPEP